MKQFFLALFLFTFSVCYSQGPTFGIQGKVVDSATKIPLNFITVFLIGSDGSHFKAGTGLDGTGAYRFDSLLNMADFTQMKLLKPEVTYFISAYDEMQGYYCSHKIQISTIGFTTSKTFTCDFELVHYKQLKNWPLINFPYVPFGLCRWTLSPSAKDSLDIVAKILKENPTLLIEIIGRVDTRERDSLRIHDFSSIVSKRRADTCRKYLISKGVDPFQLEKLGVGDSRPLIYPGLLKEKKTWAEKEKIYTVDREASFAILSLYYTPVRTVIYPQEYIPGISLHFREGDTILSKANRDSMKAVFRILRRYLGPVIELDIYADVGEEKDWSYMIASSRINRCEEYIKEQGIDPARFYIKMCDMNKEYSNTGKFKLAPIYYIPTLIPVLFSIVGTVTDEKTHNPIANATVHMIGTDLTNIPHNTDASGVYMFYPYDFNPGVSYQMKCVAPGYTIATAKDSVITNGLNASKKFEVDFVLRK